MNPPVLLFITILTSVTTEGRLIHKNKTKPIQLDPTEKPNPSIRLTRNLDEYLLSGYSGEDIVANEEFIRSYNRRANRYFRPNRTQAPKMARLTRVERDSSETRSVTRTVPRMAMNQRTVLIKKPIPKFTDIDYDDDFQTASNKGSRSLFTDFGDHEDVDFNLEDYDFDVNHDEFTSGRKPLEPRISINSTDNLGEIINPKTFSKINPLDTIRESIKLKMMNDSKNSVERSAEDDYYDEVPTTKASLSVNNKDSDEYSDDDSKDDDKALSRSLRSWDEDITKINEPNKQDKITLKGLTLFPMFPELN